MLSIVATQCSTAVALITVCRWAEKPEEKNVYIFAKGSLTYNLSNC